MDSNSLFTNIHEHVSRRTDVRSIIFSVILILIGGIAFYFSIIEENESSSLSMLVMTIGAACLLLGVFRLFWKSHSWFYTPTDSRISVKSEFYEAADFRSLKSVLESSDFSGEKTVKSGNTGGIRMDYMYSRDRKFAAVQLYQFSSYIYQPVTDVYYYKDMVADEFICCAEKKMF
ncbi:hypothetical protein [uncultured Bacteroides sp.]|uniref:hypothetical protein n=1 Tax=uncultured Bacteroides sp. TaxID=162156 RepID=UPI002633967B|nr:hypothetical protein [uncultured Bacteroides sp.]